MKIILRYFEGGHFIAETNKNKYFVVNNKDILPLIAARVADIGIVGSDLFDEFRYRPEGFGLKFQQIGEPMGRFALQTTIDLQKSVEEKICKGLPISVATKYEYALARLRAESGLSLDCVYKPSGSTEVYPELGCAETSYEIVASGETMAANCPIEIALNYQFYVVPGLVCRRSIQPSQQSVRYNGDES